jgi:hypothetical protein
LLDLLDQAQQNIRRLEADKRRLAQRLAQYEPAAAPANPNCPLPRSGRILRRMLPNWRPIGGCLLHREFGKRVRRLSCLPPPGVLPRTPL